MAKGSAAGGGGEARERDVDRHHAARIHAGHASERGQALPAPVHPDAHAHAHPDAVNADPDAGARAAAHPYAPAAAREAALVRDPHAALVAVVAVAQ